MVYKLVGNCEIRNFQFLSSQQWVRFQSATGIFTEVTVTMYLGSESPKGGRQKRQCVENEKEGKVREGRRRLWSKPPAIVAVSQSGVSKQDFVPDSIGGKFS